MNRFSLTMSLCLFSFLSFAQISPAITNWLQNTTATGSYYNSGSSTTVDNGILVNCQKVEYSTDWVYVTTAGVPSYPTGPFLDGNPSQAEDQDAIFRFPLAPVENTGTKTETNAANIGLFINGVALFDYRDGVSYSLSDAEDKGGAGGGMGDGVWNRDAIPAELDGFDCSKGHPAMGNYHHHQNPSAFKLDKVVISTICTLYDADGLYAIDSTSHSPLLGYAHDGFPIYGAYGYVNTDGTGGIGRMKSSYSLRSISVRTHYADGTDVTDGPAVSGTYPLGHYREDYEYISSTASDRLDEHNGRFCVTPEYPAGTYCYFATVDENWNSSYPYVVGPTFYGTVTAGEVSSVSESTTEYTTSAVFETKSADLPVSVFPNPSAELIAVQIGTLVKQDLNLGLYDMSGKLIDSYIIRAGSTIGYIDVETVYAGTYLLKISNDEFELSQKVVVTR